jgi:hypothetical protein
MLSQKNGIWVYFQKLGRAGRGRPHFPPGPTGGDVEPEARRPSARFFPQTVQILIGLIHLGFGSVLLMVRRGHLGMLFIEGGVPFWGGACVSTGVIGEGACSGSPLPPVRLPLFSWAQPI